jgi:hypothetical protein
MLHGPADGCPNLEAGLAQPSPMPMTEETVVALKGNSFPVPPLGNHERITQWNAGMVVTQTERGRSEVGEERLRVVEERERVVEVSGKSCGADEHCDRSATRSRRQRVAGCAKIGEADGWSPGNNAGRRRFQI